MENLPDKTDLDAAIRRTAIKAGMVTIKSVIPEVDTALVLAPRTVGAEFIEEVMRPWPGDL